MIPVKCSAEYSRDLYFLFCHAAAVIIVKSHFISCLKFPAVDLFHRIISRHKYLFPAQKRFRVSSTLCHIGVDLLHLFFCKRINDIAASVFVMLREIILHAEPFALSYLLHTVDGSDLSDHLISQGCLSLHSAQPVFVQFNGGRRITYNKLSLLKVSLPCIVLLAE